MPQLLASTQSKPASVLITGARVLDPREGIDAGHDVLVLGGEIAEIGASG